MKSSQQPSRVVLREALEILKAAEATPPAPEVQASLGRIADLLSTRASLIERIRDACASVDPATRVLLLSTLEPSLHDVESELSRHTARAQEVLRSRS